MKILNLCFFSQNFDFDLGLGPLDVAAYEHFRAPTGLAQHTVAMSDDAQFQSHKSEKICRFRTEKLQKCCV